MKKVWIVYTEIAPTPDHENGAFVECYVFADEILGAIELAQAHMKQDGFDVVNITRCVLFDVDDWDDENDSEREVRDAVYSVVKTRQSQYGFFRAWDEDDPQGDTGQKE